MAKKSKFATIQLIVYYVALLISILVIIDFSIESDDSPLQEFICKMLVTLLLVSLLVIVCFAVGDVIYTIIIYQKQELSMLADGIKKIKLLTIPCYIMNFIVGVFCCGMLIGTIVASFPGLVMAVVLISGTCLVIALTGMYGILYVSLYNKSYPENRIGGLHYLLQLIPCLDVISSAMLLWRHRRQVRK